MLFILQLSNFGIDWVYNWTNINISSWITCSRHACLALSCLQGFSFELMIIVLSANAFFFHVSRLAEHIVINYWRIGSQQIQISLVVTIEPIYLWSHTWSWLLLYIVIRKMIKGRCGQLWAPLFQTEQLNSVYYLKNHYISVTIFAFFLPFRGLT